MEWEAMEWEALLALGRLYRLGAPRALLIEKKLRQRPIRRGLPTTNREDCIKED